jgi:NAD-dependent dihydropyrimidine dehydrogenase PreA subunit
MSPETVEVDGARCTGCGACVDVCPVGAIALVDGKASVNEESCMGCEACVDVCPEGAIEPIIQGELVPVPERPSPTVYQPGPLARTAGTAVAAVGAGLLLRTARSVARAMGRWLARRPPGTALGQARQGLVQRDAAETAPRSAGRGGRGRQVRRRRRGG